MLQRKRGKPAGSSDDNVNLASEQAACNGNESSGPVVNFKIVVGDGLVVGRKVLPDDLRKIYPNLCEARKAFVHRNLLKQISPMLAAGVIVETAKIAEGYKEAKLERARAAEMLRGVESKLSALKDSLNKMDGADDGGECEGEELPSCARAGNRAMVSDDRRHLFLRAPSVVASSM